MILLGTDPAREDCQKLALVKSLLGDSTRESGEVVQWIRKWFVINYHFWLYTPVGQISTHKILITSSVFIYLNIHLTELFANNAFCQRNKKLGHIWAFYFRCTNMVAAMQTAPYALCNMDTHTWIPMYKVGCGQWSCIKKIYALQPDALWKFQLQSPIQLWTGKHSKFLDLISDIARTLGYSILLFKGCI